MIHLHYVVRLFDWLPGGGGAKGGDGEVAGEGQQLLQNLTSLMSVAAPPSFSFSATTYFMGVAECIKT